MRRLWVLFVVLVSARCVMLQTSSRPAPLDRPFWDEPGRQVVVAIGYVGEPDYDRSGGDSLYHALVSDARDARLTEFSTRYQPLLDELTSAAAEVLRREGFESMERPAPLLDVAQYASAPQHSDLPWAEQSRAMEACSKRGDLQPLADARTLRASLYLESERQRLCADDLALVLSIPYWGFSRLYDGIIPVSAPYAYFHVEGDLLDVRNGVVLWTSSVRKDVAFDRRWNEPPDHHPKVRAALDEAFRQASAELMEELLGWDGNDAAYPPVVEGRVFRFPQELRGKPGGSSVEHERR